MANFLTLHKQQGGQALRDLLARPLGNMLTVLALAFSLALPATLFMLAKNIVAVTEQWQAPNQITVYLQPMQDERAQAFSDEIGEWPDVASATYISPDEGLQQLRQIQGFDAAVSLLDDNPLPSVVVITPRAEDAASATALASKLRTNTNIDEVRLDSDWLQRLAAIESLVLTLTTVFSGLMLMAVFLIIGNTLRLQVLNQKEEIQVMKLVGATDSYILRPYIYTGVWLALAGAVVAWIVVQVNALLLDAAVEKLATLYSSAFRLSGLGVDETFLLLLVTGLIGLLAARLAAGKHLKEIEPVS
ncbi:permease-like cell division protein FtsX [Enterovibrio nigricans]|uniref:Cell division protein FtsX n=1 Tax=Enterovibrio nigricans DSM 22720 TaxID=1121868 RepID=A0A1T4UGK8_9GAMM|nr:permease-like cell division protein FtsX [Enterovibrio nigricans]PKF51266.1 cell division protein FtsX [Enterovibrio nigricans]SKA51819.1 cell division protein FtsX [Enterovibrio nigricans DSM 22720]